MEQGDGGYWHYQGLLQTANKVRPGAVQKTVKEALKTVALLPDGLLSKLWIERKSPKSSLDQCVQYIKKEGKYKGKGKWFGLLCEYGQARDRDEAEVNMSGLAIKGPKGQGKRTDLHDLAGKVRKGVRGAELVDSDETAALIIKYAKGVAELGKMLDNADMRKKTLTYVEPDVITFWGASGTGKSKIAYDLACMLAVALDYCDKIEDAHKFIYNVSYSGGFWLGYSNEPIWLWNEFTGATSINASAWKNILDKPAQRRALPVKGSEAFNNCRVLINTSNIDPRLWWPEETGEAQKKAIFRRLPHTFEFKGDTWDKMEAVKDDLLKKPKTFQAFSLEIDLDDADDIYIKNGHIVQNLTGDIMNLPCKCVWHLDTEGPGYGIKCTKHWTEC